MKKQFLKIRCPYCNAEYLPSEIYLPNDFLGKPKTIEKTDVGKILDFVGHTMDLSESYECDICRKTFKIKASVYFNVTKENELDFSEDFSIPYSKEQK